MPWGELTLRAWACTLHGREDEVPPLLGVEKDPMVASTLKGERRPEVQSLLASYSRAVVGLFRELLSIVKRSVEMLWASKPETRMICMLGWSVTNMRDSFAGADQQSKAG